MEDSYLKKVGTYLALGWTLFSAVAALVFGYMGGADQVALNFLFLMFPVCLLTMIWFPYLAAIWVVRLCDPNYEIPDSPVHVSLNSYSEMPRGGSNVLFTLIQFFFFLIMGAAYLYLAFFLYQKG